MLSVRTATPARSGHSRCPVTGSVSRLSPLEKRQQGVTPGPGQEVICGKEQWKSFLPYSNKFNYTSSRTASVWQRTWASSCRRNRSSDTFGSCSRYTLVSQGVENLLRDTWANEVVSLLLFPPVFWSHHFLMIADHSTWHHSLCPALLLLFLLRLLPRAVRIAQNDQRWDLRVKDA